MPCLGCGACCACFEVIPVEDEDDVPEDLTEIGGIMGCFSDETHMKVVNGRCVALVGEVGVDAQCSIYERRPHVCRGFEPLETQCKQCWEDYRNRPSESLSSLCIQTGIHIAVSSSSR